MTHSRQVLIGDLVGDLKPVHRPGQTWRAWLAWLAIAGSYSASIVFVTGGVRANGVAAVIGVPAYALEILVAVATIALLAHSALRTAIPEGHSWLRRLWLPYVALATWCGLVAWGLVGDSALPASAADERSNCFLQGLIFSVPSFVLMLWLARGLLPLWPRATGALAGAAAAALPAVLMQIACMYEPAHALLYHLSTIPMLAALGALVGPRVLQRRAVVARRRRMPIH